GRTACPTRAAPSSARAGCRAPLELRKISASVGGKAEICLSLAYATLWASLFLCRHGRGFLSFYSPYSNGCEPDRSAGEGPLSRSERRRFAWQIRNIPAAEFAFKEIRTYVENSQSDAVFCGPAVLCRPSALSLSWRGAADPRVGAAAPAPGEPLYPA